MNAPRYLVPVSQTPDAPFIVKPSRMFPWVGIGYPLVVGIGLPGAAWVAEDVRGRLMIDSSGYLSAQAVILLLQVSALVWGIVHAARLARVRRRLALSLDDVAPPPPDYINAVQLDDARLYRRDDRTPVVRALVAGLAWVSRFLDDLGRGADDFTPAPSSGQIQQTFNARRSPRRGFVSAICLLTLAWLGLTVLTFGPISDRIPGDASLLIVIVASGAVQLGVLFIIGGVRMSIDSSFRKRIFRLRRESAALTARAPIKRSRHP